MTENLEQCLERLIEWRDSRQLHVNPETKYVWLAACGFDDEDNPAPTAQPQDKAAESLAKIKVELAFMQARLDTAHFDNVRLIAAMEKSAEDMRNMPDPRAHEIADRLEEEAMCP